MPTAPLPETPNRPRFWSGFFAALTAQSVGWTLGLALAAGALLSPKFITPWPVVFGRVLFVAVLCLLAFAAAGQWRSRWVPRWWVQLISVGLAAPGATFLAYLLSTGGDLGALVGNPARMTGLVMIGGSALGLGLAVALGALYRARDAEANAQALLFALERETLQRQATDAQLAVLQSQIEPHFLFNTLANVQALVESGSSRAAPVLASLVAYLRAAMPQIHSGTPTLGQEEKLVRAYLELMQMRMPDRLSFAVEVPAGLRDLPLPPMTLLTLVENAVRHGIDPSETGGRIEVGAGRSTEGRMVLWVEDSGRGIDESGVPGVGLANLRERLSAAYGQRA
ncbi:MAG: histidine kinase, partial [Burkholderiaceae bacterium]